LTTAGPVIADQYTMLVVPADDRVLYLKDHHIMEAKRSGGSVALWQVRPLFSAARLVEHPELADVQTLIDTGSGGLWFGCGLRLCNLQAQKLTIYGAALGVPAAQYGTLLQDGQGTVWARSLDHLLRRTLDASHFDVIDPPHAALANRLQRLTLTLDPTRRVTTRTGLGLAFWDGSTWKEYGPQNGLPDSPITGALADADGNFWLAASGIGLYRWHGYDNIESWTKNQGLDPEPVWNIVRDQQHRLILGTDLGCRVLDETTHLVGRCPYQGFPEQETNASAVDPSGALWLANQPAQLWRVAPGAANAQRVTTVPEHFYTAAMLFDHSGTGWIAAV
jgi:ligand-binding sensor domain-containing protein